MAVVLNRETQWRVKGLLGQLRVMRSQCEASEKTLTGRRINRARWLRSKRIPLVSGGAFDDAVRTADNALHLLAYEMLPWLEDVVREMDRVCAGGAAESTREGADGV